MKWFQNISFKLFLVCFVFIMITVSILDALAYRYIKQEITDTRRENARMLLMKEEQYLNMYFLMQQNTLNSLSSSIGAMKHQEDTVQSLLERFYDMNASMLSDLYLIRKDLSIIGGGIVSSAFNEPAQERKVVYDRTYEKPYSVTISNLYKSSLSGWTVTFSIPIPFDGERAVLAMDLSLSSLQRKLAEISGNSDLSLGILDLKGGVIASPAHPASITYGDQEMRIGKLASKEIITNTNDMFEVSTETTPVTILKTIIPHYQWVIFAIVDDTRFHSSLQKMDKYFAGLLLLGAALSFVLSLLVARYIRGPVHYLIRKMQQVRSGNLAVAVTYKRSDEFGELAHSFDEMLSRIRVLIDNLNRTERFKKEMELQVLQSQINPHFLYNTLGSISNVVAVGKTEEVDPIIEALISILEYGITDFSEKVSLEKELSNVRDYLFIQNIRYDCVFHLTEDIEEGLNEFPVLKMILQPIVENSIFHGYTGGRIEGGIHIAAFRKEGDVMVEVRDQGIGIPPERAEMILLPHSNQVHPGSRKRIGLYNIHQRIGLYYGSNYGVQVESREGVGTCIRLVFPDETRGG